MASVILRAALTLTVLRGARPSVSWAVVIGVACVVLLLLPDLYARLGAPAGYLGLSSTVVLEDRLFYWNYAQQILGGDLSPENNLSVLTQGQQYYYPHAYLIAAVAVLTGISIPGSMLLLRLLAGLFLLVCIHRFLARLLPDGRERNVCFLLAIFGGGLAWLLTLRNLGAVLERPDLFSALPLVHTSTFNSLYLLEHFAIALGLMLEVLGRFTSVATDGRLRDYAGAAVAHGLLSMWHTYEVITVSAVVLVTVALEGWHARKVPIPRLVGAMAVIASAVPGSLLLFFLNYQPVMQLERDDIWVWPAEWLSALGLPALLTLAYLILAVRNFGIAGAGHRLVTRGFHGLLAWVLVTPVLVYLPFYFRRKLAAGIQIPLAVLAGLFVLAMVDRLFGKTLRGRVALAGFCLVICLGTMDRLGSDLLFLRMRTVPLYLDQDEMSVMKWLRSHTSRDETVVMEPAFLSHLIPALTGNRTLLGWRAMVPDYQNVRLDWEAFLGDGADRQLRRDFLNRYPLDYVILKRGEGAVASGPGQLAAAPGLPRLELQAGFGAFWIYRVRRRVLLLADGGPTATSVSLPEISSVPGALQGWARPGRVLSWIAAPGEPGRRP